MGLVMGASTANAQHHYVTTRPAAHEEVRGTAPSSHHVWVGGEYKWSGGTYVQSKGHWAVPPHGHHKWVDGHWASGGHKGEYWVAGHWS